MCSPACRRISAASRWAATAAAVDFSTAFGRIWATAAARSASTRPRAAARVPRARSASRARTLAAAWPARAAIPAHSRSVLASWANTGSSSASRSATRSAGTPAAPAAPGDPAGRKLCSTSRTRTISALLHVGGLRTSHSRDTSLNGADRGLRSQSLAPRSGTAQLALQQRATDVLDIEALGRDGCLITELERDLRGSLGGRAWQMTNLCHPRVKGRHERGVWAPEQVLEPLAQADGGRPLGGTLS